MELDCVQWLYLTVEDIKNHCLIQFANYWYPFSLPGLECYCVFYFYQDFFSPMTWMTFSLFNFLFIVNPQTISLSFPTSCSTFWPTSWPTSWPASYSTFYFKSWPTVYYWFIDFDTPCLEMLLWFSLRFCTPWMCF